jgi:hypothetical protein
MMTRKSLAVQGLLVLMLAATIAVTGPGCASKKKLAKQQAELKARQDAEARAKKLAEAKTILLSIINDQGSMTLDEKEKKLDGVKAQHFDDPEINDLIRQAEAVLAKERETANAARLAAEKEKTATSRTARDTQMLEQDFMAIAQAGSVQQANTIIGETLRMFAGDDVPVLIIIYKDQENTDYDEPTTIRKYLEFLKDQKKNPNAVYSIKYDANNQISELDLIKK